MQHPILFWALCALVTLALALVSFHFDIHRRNLPYNLWLWFACSTELLGAIGLAQHRPAWYGFAGHWSAQIGLVLGAAIVIAGGARWNDPANRALALAFGAMWAFQLFGLEMAARPALLSPAAWTWYRNFSFFGPAAYLLFAFCGLHLDRLPLRAVEKWIPAFAGMTEGALARGAEMARAMLG